MTARALAGGFQVTRLPDHDLPQGRRHAPRERSRLHPADKFLKLVRYIGDGHMDRGVSWEEYSRSTDPGAK